MRLWILALAALGFVSIGRAEGARRPNIVFILADDLGYTDLACYGSKFYETPHLDRMAAEGVRFTDGYTCGANCQPTRAALLSGQYGPRTGVYTVGNIDRFNWRSRPLRPVDNVTKLPLETVTIADALKQAGYVTGMFGKWHLGNDAAHHPLRRGFDEAIESSGQHFGFKTDPPQDVPEDKYLADFLTDKAVDFIERHKSEPFLLYLPHYGVHAPFQAKPELIEQFKGKPAAGKHRDPTYAAMIASVDESVGRVLATLEAQGIAGNTLVIFSSDNGGVGGYQSVGLDKNGVTDNAPLKGGKGTFYEGGVRVPYVFSWPGVIEGGRTNSTPIISVDLYPTLLALAGAKPPAAVKLDGVSYVPLLKGEQDTLEREAVFWHFPGYLGQGADAWRTKPVSVVRAGDWKLHEYLEDGSLELYNLKQDVGERKNLAAAEPERARQLHDTLHAWRKDIGAKLPAANVATDDGADKPRKGGKGGKRKERARKRALRTT